MIVLPDGVSMVLASSSPRRRSLLAGAGLAFSVRPARIDETPFDGEAPAAYVSRLAVAKADAVAGTPPDPDVVVLAADTTVEVDGTILEKPVDRRDAVRMLRSLSGRGHRCHTGVAVVRGDRRIERLVTTDVDFVALDDTAIEWYVATGEADDKAGGYGIQGAAGAFVSSVHGSVTNVIGLPLAETLDMIRRAAA